MTDALTSDQALPSDPDDRDVARNQVWLLLLGLLGTLIVFVLAHACQARDQMLLPHRLAVCKEINGQYIDCRFYSSPEERLLHKVIPNDDYSRGGVYFLGGSQLERSLALQDCSPAEQAVIHNYCLGATPHGREFQFLRYLVEQAGILRAGGDKNLVVFDLCFTAAAHFPTESTIKMDAVWAHYFTQHGMYNYDPTGGITSSGRNDLWRSLRFRKIETDAFCTTVVNILQGAVPNYMLEPTIPSPAYIKFWTDYLGPDWRAGMDIELKQFGKMIDYLHERHVGIEAVYLPLGSWFADFEPAKVYRERVFALLKTKGVHITDLANRLGDDGFGDSIHPSYRGVMQIGPILNNIARKHLTAKQIVPSPGG
jgi:hypothetical protein